MTLTSHADSETGTRPAKDESPELKLAEAELAAADAEAAAALAQADAARARARLLCLRKDSDDKDHPADELVAESPVAATTTTRGRKANRSVRTKPENTTPATTEDKGTQKPVGSEARQPSRLRRFVGVLIRPLRPLRHPTKRGAAVAAMSLIALAALVVTGLIGWNHNQVQSENSRATTFTAAAHRGVEAITSLDYRNAQRDIQRVLDQSTGAFYNDFNGRSKDFASVIEQSQVTTKGNVTASAVESINGDDAVVLVSANSEVTNAAGAKQEPRVWRLRVTVTDIDGTMKVSKVDFVP